jgi:hypothetical protein
MEDHEIQSDLNSDAVDRIMDDPSVAACMSAVAAAAIELGARLADLLVQEGDEKALEHQDDPESKTVRGLQDDGTNEGRSRNH